MNCYLFIKIKLNQSLKRIGENCSISLWAFKPKTSLGGTTNLFNCFRFMLGFLTYKYDHVKQTASQLLQIEDRGMTNDCQPNSMSQRWSIFSTAANQLKISGA
jgi:hypothetical protein